MKEGTYKNRRCCRGIQQEAIGEEMHMNCYPNPIPQAGELCRLEKLLEEQNGLLRSLTQALIRTDGR